MGLNFRINSIVYVGEGFTTQFGYEVSEGEYMVTDLNPYFVVLNDIYVSGIEELNQRARNPEPPSDNGIYHVLLTNLPNREFSKNEFPTPAKIIPWLVWELEQYNHRDDKFSIAVHIYGPATISIDSKVVQTILSLHGDSVPDELIYRYREIQDRLDSGDVAFIGYDDEGGHFHVDYFECRDSHTETLMGLKYPDCSNSVWVGGKSA